MISAPPASPALSGSHLGFVAHDFDDKYAAMTRSSRVNFIDRAGRNIDRGLETERHVGAPEIVVDRLRHADDIQTFLGKTVGGFVKSRCRLKRSGSRVRAHDTFAFMSLTLLLPFSSGLSRSLNGTRLVPRMVPPRVRMSLKSALVSMR